MSLPRKSPPSVEPAKLEVTPGHQTPRSTSLLPSVFSHDDGYGEAAEGYEGERLAALFMSGDQSQFATQTIRENVTDTVDESDNPDASEEPEQPAGFAPFFTLIEDSTTGEQHHPHVYYIFSDDEPELISNALVNTLDPHNTRGEELSPEEASRGNKERYLVVDIAKDGQGALAAKSLTAEWQVTKTSISTAPTFDESTAEEAGLMLRIEGSQIVDRTAESRNALDRAKAANNGDVFAAMNSLSRQVQEAQELLDTLVELRLPQPSND